MLRPQRNTASAWCSPIPWRSTQRMAVSGVCGGRPSRQCRTRARHSGMRAGDAGVVTDWIAPPSNWPRLDECKTLDNDVAMKPQALKNRLGSGPKAPTAPQRGVIRPWLLGGTVAYLVVFAIPYGCSFSGGLSKDAEHWAAFGSYWGSVLAGLAAMAVLFQLFQAASQFNENSKRELFVNLLEAFEKTTNLMSATMGTSSANAPTRELDRVLAVFETELNNVLIENAHQLIAKQPPLICDCSVYEMGTLKPFRSILQPAGKLTENSRPALATLLRAMQFNTPEDVRDGFLKFGPAGENVIRKIGKIEFYRSDEEFGLRAETISDCYETALNSTDCAYFDAYMRQLICLLRHIGTSSFCEDYVRILISRISANDLALIYYGGMIKTEIGRALSRELGILVAEMKHGDFGPRGISTDRFLSDLSETQ